MAKSVRPLRRNKEEQNKGRWREVCGFVARMSTNQWTEEFRKLAADDLDSSDISRVSCSLQRVAYGRRADILSVLARPQYPANTVKGR